LLVSACGNAANSSENTEESAKEAGSKFVEKLYNVDDPDFYEKNFVSTDDDRNRAKAINELKEEFSPYLTETELKSLTDTSFLYRPVKTEDVWKIDRYYDDDLPIEMFNP